MDFLSSVVQFVSSIGLPSAIIAELLYLAFKMLPDYQKAKQEERKEQQEYYNKRNDSYNAQMQSFLDLAEKTNVLLGETKEALVQSTEVIRANTEAIKFYAAKSERIGDSLERGRQAPQGGMHSEQ